VIVRFVDIGGIVDHHCSNFPFLIFEMKWNHSSSISWYMILQWMIVESELIFTLSILFMTHSWTPLICLSIHLIYTLLNITGSIPLLVDFISKNIPASSAYGVYISQLIRYSRACAQYIEFLDKAQLLTQKLLKQGYADPRLKSTLHILYGRHHNLVDRYEISISK
jgi:hypothetical protein